MITFRNSFPLSQPLKRVIHSFSGLVVNFRHNSVIAIETFCGYLFTYLGIIEHTYILECNIKGKYIGKFLFTHVIFITRLIPFGCYLKSNEKVRVLREGFNI